MKWWCSILVKIVVALLAALGAVSLSVAEEREYSFAVTDIVGLEELQREFAEFEAKLSSITGIDIKLYPVTSRTAVVESLRSKRLDFALSGPAEYIIARKKAGVDPLVLLKRSGYKSVLVVKKDGPVKTIQDIKGRKVAFGDFGSTSYHLGPLQLLKDNGISIDDIRGVNISKQVAWKSFLRGDVDVIGMGKLRFSQYSNAQEGPGPDAFRLLAEGPALPGDVILAGAHVADAVKGQLQRAIADHSEEILSSMLKGVRNKKYLEMEFTADVKDSDYDYVRSMYVTAGYPEFAG